MDQNDIRAALLAAISSISPGSSLQSNTVLREVANKLSIRGDADEQIVLTQFYELFRTGYLAWGLNFSNPSPPFFHLTEQSRSMLAALSSDPGNPRGYLLRIDAIASINPIARSYLDEALRCYVADLNKASAVMVGAASESLILELRDTLLLKLAGKGQSAPSNLKDWRVSKILLGLKSVLDSQGLPAGTRDRYEAYWPAFTQQIRTGRNDAGHPSTVTPVTREAVHASLLIFPDLTTIAADLRTWISSNL